MKKLLLAAVMATASGATCAESAAPAEVPFDHFIKHDQFLDVKISPTGEYLAATILAAEDTGALIVLRTSDMKASGHFKLAGKTLVSGFNWVSDERLVFGVAKKDGSKSNPQGTGELYGMNADGKDTELLIGPNAGSGHVAAGFLEDTLLDDDKFVIIYTRGVGNDEGDYPKLEKMNVRTGARTIVARSPIMNSTFLLDNAKNARFVWGETSENRQKLYYRAAKGGDWEVINDEAQSGVQMTPHTFSRDDSKVYVQVTEKAGPDSMQVWDVATRKMTLLARDDDTDPSNLLYTADGAEPYGVVFRDGAPRAEVFNPDLPEAKLRASLAASFPDSWISITSYTKDQNNVVFKVWSDRNPGEFYQFDRKAKKATYLLSTAQWIDKDAMAVMRPIKFAARDGRQINGFLTLPPGGGKNLPLIINPHGGPIGVYEQWGYNFEVQLLASRGYAVIQIDYRGSGNHGREHMRAGYQKWGSGMIDDMTDAVAWAAKEGHVDKDRVCIYGASYGGYAATQAAVREPDLYKCAVGYVGVYDLAMMYTRGDVRNRDSGMNYLEEAMGSGREFLVKYSPRYNVDKIKVPVFLIAGKDDFRAHPDHSRAMAKELEKAGKLHEYLEKEYEGHGFYKEENKRELYTKMLAFFEKHIGKGAGKPVASN